MDNKTLHQLISDSMDADELIDLLGIGVEELCVRFRGKIQENREMIEEHIDPYGEYSLDEESLNDNEEWEQDYDY